MHEMVAHEQIGQTVALGELEVSRIGVAACEDRLARGAGGSTCFVNVHIFRRVDRLRDSSRHSVSFPPPGAELSRERVRRI